MKSSAFVITTTSPIWRRAGYSGYLDTSLRPEGSTEKADLAVACVLAQRPSSATEITKILSSWRRDKFIGEWKHPRSTVYCVLQRFGKWNLLEKKKQSGKSTIYSFRKPAGALDTIWQRFTKRHWRMFQPRQHRGPQPERVDNRKIGILRLPIPGWGYDLAVNIISEDERRRLADEIADPKYAPELNKALRTKRMVTTELENRARALLRQQKQQARRRSVVSWPIRCHRCGKEDLVPLLPDPGRPIYCRSCHAKIRRGPRIVLRPYIDWKRGSLDLRGMTRERSF